MRLGTIIVACVVSLLAAQTAFAAPNRLTLLQQAVENRPEDALTKAQIKAIAKADKLLGKTPANTTAEVTTAIAVMKLLDKAFPGDAQFAFVLGNAIPDLQSDVTADRDALATLLAALPDGKKKAASQTALDAAEAAIGGVATSDTGENKLDLLKTAIVSIGKGFNAVTKRQSYIVFKMDDGGGPRWIFVAKVRAYITVDPFSQELQYVVKAYPTRRQEIEMLLFPVAGTGAFALQNEDHDFGNSAGGWIDYPAFYETTKADPGVATITRYDDLRVLDATFSFTAKNSDTGNTVTVTDGFFRIR
jgi:hypothetical protein